MTDNLEKRIESWDDVRNAFDNLLKKYVYRFSWRQELLKRYKHGDVTIHLHCVGTQGVLPWCHCIEVEAKTGSACRRGGSTFMEQHGEFVSPDSSNRQEREPVLVSVYEVTKDSESFIPSIVRLHALDEVNRRCGDRVVRELRATISHEMRSGFRDRELEAIPAPQWSPGIPIGELPCNVIETGSQIDKAITENTTQHERRINDEDRSDRYDILIAFNDEPVRIAIHVRRDIRLERIQMMFCPDDFEPGSIEGVAHV